jgi:hypothetical protein
MEIQENMSRQVEFLSDAASMMWLTSSGVDRQGDKNPWVTVGLGIGIASPLRKSISL